MSLQLAASKPKCVRSVFLVWGRIPEVWRFALNIGLAVLLGVSLVINFLPGRPAIATLPSSWRVTVVVFSCAQMYSACRGWYFARRDPDGYQYGRRPEFRWYIALYGVMLTAGTIVVMLMFVGHTYSFRAIDGWIYGCSVALILAGVATPSLGIDFPWAAGIASSVIPQLAMAGVFWTSHTAALMWSTVASLWLAVSNRFLNSGYDYFSSLSTVPSNVTGRKPSRYAQRIWLLEAANLASLAVLSLAKLWVS